ncbi:MAG: hypothetical protein PUH90_06785 [Clostridia bacterium]|nr:hypothetical protein [Clostridia bacterium]MDY3724388.1 hypothetical protein [Christensenellaceae bacterium]
MEKSNAITKYDKYLKVVKICVAVFCILFAIFVLLSAIVLFATSEEVVEVPGYYNTHGYYTHTEVKTNVVKIVSGVLILIFGPVIIYLSYAFSMAIISFALDLKFVRNNLYEIDNTKLCLDFGLLKRSNETSEYNGYNAGSPLNNKNDTEQGVCALCGKKSNVTYCKIVDSMGTRYRRICADCMAKTNAIPSEKEN